MDQWHARIIRQDSSAQSRLQLIHKNHSPFPDGGIVCRAGKSPQHLLRQTCISTKGRETLIVQSRWKSKVVWASILATMLTLLGNLGLYEALGIEKEPLQHMIDAVLALLVAFGVLNNPTDAEHF